MHIPERLKLRLFDLTAPAIDPLAQDCVSQAQHALNANDTKAALALFAEAIGHDGRALIRPWGLEPKRAQDQFDVIRTLMKTRLERWYRDTKARKAPPVARLADKIALRDWAKDQTAVRIPTPLGQFDGFNAVPWPKFETQSVVIKPRHGAMARGVLVLSEGFDLMRHQQVGPSLAQYAAKIWETESVKDGAVLAEALVRDPAPDTAIPRDFKGFCVAGKVAFVVVQDTNGPGGYQAFRQRRAFDAKGHAVPRTHGSVPDIGEATLPARFFEVVTAMERLSAIFPQALRLDFYLDHDGPVLGEITTYPNAGLGFAPFSARTFHQMLAVSAQLE